MALIQMTQPAESFSFGNRGTVIVQVDQDIRGGKTLDCTDFLPTHITEGHVIIKETSTGTYKPMPTNVGMTAYGTLPVGHVYVGVQINEEIPKELPFPGIMIGGIINPVTAPYDFATIATAFKTAVPLISQIAD